MKKSKVEGLIKQFIDDTEKLKESNKNQLLYQK